MVDRKFLAGVLTGFFGLAVLIVGIPYAESAIPPTAALRDIFVSTDWFSSEPTLVQATNSSDRVYYISDGSIIFNVTSSENP